MADPDVGFVPGPLVVPPGTIGCGIQLPVQSQSTIYVEAWEKEAGPDELARVALAAEAAGFLYVAVCDHTVIPRRLADAMSTTWYDTVATLGWLAGVTSTIRLLSHVYIAALRHPLRAAKEFATLDVLSGGRLVIGVGAGHVPEEFAVLGAEFAGRGALLDEALDGITAGLVAEFPELPGPRWPAVDVGVSPRPLQRPRPPIWVGGSSHRALRRAAARGDGWLPQTVKRDDLRAQVLELLDLRRRSHDGVPIEIGALPGVFYVGEPTWEVPRGTVTGSAERIAEDLHELTDLGCSHLQLRFPSRSVDELCDQIGAFGASVGPLLSQS